MKTILSQLRGAVAATILLAIFCCGIYPLLVFGIGETFFREKANGSLIVDSSGTVRGSTLLGQNFRGEKYFHPRPSAAGANGYDASSSGGSNLGPTSQKLHDAIQARVESYRQENGLNSSVAVPADAVTASGSGLDPHISLRNASLQILRVAHARGWEESRVTSLVQSNLDSASWHFFGESGVNVLKLNLALDALR